MDNSIFSILTEFVTEWQISAEEDKKRDYIADKSRIMNKALKAIHSIVPEKKSVRDCKYCGGYLASDYEKGYNDAIDQVHARIEGKD